MPFNGLPQPTVDIDDWTWEKFEPYYQELEARELSSANVEEWLDDWSAVTMLLYETYNRLYTATTVDTTDRRIAQLYQKFLDEFFQNRIEKDQSLKQKLLESRLTPEGFEIPLRNMRAASELYREANLPLLAAELKLNQEYDRIIGAQTVEWEGEEVTPMQLLPVAFEADRGRRERAWRLVAERQIQDRQALNDLWVKMLGVRAKLAENAGLPNYREYRWRQLLRFDYSPEDCRRFHQAVEKIVVPLVSRLLEQRRQKLGLGSLRPWDLDVDPQGRPPLKPFDDVIELIARASTILHQVDPQLGMYYDIMKEDGLLDLENRKGKAPGGYCIDFPVTKKPFIFMNAVGIHDDVQTILHESGHAFHNFEMANLRWFHQMDIGSEIAEVASMSMELLSSPYIDRGHGGYYSEEDTKRARLEHLESILRFWPYMSVVDAFQLWAYENQELAVQPQRCDEKWGELWDKYMVGIDTSGLEDWKVTGWQRKLHIFLDPFYYIEYGIAQLGALQVWKNAQTDQAAAVRDYRKALALGGMRSLPELYAAAGAKLAFDEPTLQEAVDMILGTMKSLGES